MHIRHAILSDCPALAKVGVKSSAALIYPTRESVSQAEIDRVRASLWTGRQV